MNLKKLKKSLSYYLFSKIYYYKGFNKNNLLILDDIFPNSISGFRFEEFTQILLQVEKSKLISTGSSYPLLNATQEDHKKHIVDFKFKYPNLKNQLFKSSRIINFNAKLVYCIFINNIYNNLFWIEKYKIPFVFTLYPGGGFQVNDEISDFKLKKVFESKQFRKVIVTQKFTQDYLIKNNFCKPETIEFIFGGVVPQISLNKDLTSKKNYLINKPTLDIVFCAAKYMPKGIDKGFDVFIEVAHSLKAKYNFIKFHVIGGFNETDIDVTALGDKISFYGFQSYENLSNIFKNIDLIISPNKPFYLDKGSFDGFPLGTVVEAVFNGCVAIVSDLLNQNVVFVNNKEILIVRSDVQEIEEKIIDLINNPDKLLSISRKGNQKFNKIYSNEIQMNPRIELLKNEIKKA